MLSSHAKRVMRRMSSLVVCAAEAAFNEGGRIALQIVHLQPKIITTTDA
jgi:hypothetical protein